MRKLTLSVATVLALGSVGMLTLLSATIAQTSTPSSSALYKACLPKEAQIVASALPEDTQTASYRTFDLSKCPIGNRPIVDAGVGSVLPLPGEAVFAESMTIEGAQVFEIHHDLSGIVELRFVGSDLEVSESSSSRVQMASPSECSDQAYNSFDNRLFETEPWYFNKSTTPDELSVGATQQKLLEGGVNVANVRNDCGVGDAVPVGMRYSGPTNSYANIDTEGRCGSSDGLSEVSFGDLPTEKVS